MAAGVVLVGCALALAAQVAAIWRLGRLQATDGADLPAGGCAVASGTLSGAEGA